MTDSNNDVELTSVIGRTTRERSGRGLVSGADLDNRDIAALEAGAELTDNEGGSLSDEDTQPLKGQRNAPLLNFVDWGDSTKVHSLSQLRNLVILQIFWVGCGILVFLFFMGYFSKGGAGHGKAPEARGSSYDMYHGVNAKAKTTAPPALDAALHAKVMALHAKVKSEGMK